KRHRHAAAAQLPLERVAVRQGRAEAFLKLQRTPPISRCTGRMSRNSTTAAPSVTAAVTPNRVGSGVVLINPADQPASLLPRAFERKNTPIISPTTCFGASLVTTDSPTGLRHSSPSSSMK